MVPAGKTRIRSLVPQFGLPMGIPSCMIRVIEQLDRSQFDAEGWVWARDSSLKDTQGLRDAVPRPLALLVNQRWGNKGLVEVLKRRFLASLTQDTVAWIFPGFDIGLVEQAKKRGALVVLERINSCDAHAKSLLDAAEARLGLPSGANITQRKLDYETRSLELADFIFSPSPFVRDSYLARGVSPDRILDTSYGWDPSTFRPRRNTQKRDGRPVFLFMGTGSVRKGLPDLLEAWDAAQLDAELRIVGRIDQAVEDRYAQVLKSDNVKVLGFRSDLDRLFEDADVFTLPSIEEGSPLVTYLALAAGVPSLVSYAGAGGIVEDNVSGLVREPDDREAFVGALKQLAEDKELRARLAEGAATAAPKYTWKNVAERRSLHFAQVSHRAL